MTPRQRTARKAWRAAMRAYAIAARGERDATRKRRNAAALEVIKADIEAANTKQRRAA